jgi:8-oxo-dGTP diphosphatase
VRNFGGVYVVSVKGEKPELKVEDDHTLVWLDPRDAVVALRHDAHAWAVAAWLRRG